MTDDEFAAIKAAFPAIVWHLDRTGVARADSVTVCTVNGGAAWEGYAVRRGGHRGLGRTLPDCLAALRAALVAERDALTAILGEVPDAKL